MSQPRHGRRIIALWAIATLASVLLIVLVFEPHMPPGDMTDEAADQRRANTILIAAAAPIVLGIAIYLVYAAVFFRRAVQGEGDGPHDTGSGRGQVLWLGVTTTLVLLAAGYGTYELIPGAKGAGGGQGPDPIAKPAGYQSALKVQVIGQQWNWTYRFPQLGRFETVQLKLPVGRVVELHVTSLDVAHSFWAFELGVKADAMPGSDNVAYVRARRTGSFEVRCSEVCGLWHGHMYQSAEVVEGAAFDRWIREQRASEGGNRNALPPYSPQYYPDPQRRAD
jgi:cytochrome c oxidase subunit II